MSTIARTVFESEQVSLINGDEVTLRPLQIKYARQIVKLYRQLISISEITVDPEEKDSEVIVTNMEQYEDAMYEILFKMVVICLNKLTNKSYTVEEVEDIMDEQTMNHMIKVCAGIDLNPKEQTTLTS